MLTNFNISAFESKINHIIIEHQDFGNNISRWIIIGNFLHKTSVISGAVCLLTPLFAPRKMQQYVLQPLCVLNLMCTTLYNFSWCRDPCCKYQIEGNQQRLEQLHLQTLASSSPLILVMRDDKYRRRLHNFVSTCCAGYLLLQLYRYYKG